MTPAMQVEMTQVQHIMAISMMEGTADPNQDALTKEEVYWDLWDKE